MDDSLKKTHSQSQLFRVPKGFRPPGLRPKICRAPELQDKNIGAPRLHNISFGAPRFTVIRYSGFEVSKFSGLRSPQQKFRGSRDPPFGTLTFNDSTKLRVEKVIFESHELPYLVGVNFPS